MKKLIVAFDIDGTLLHADGAGRFALTSALKERFGSPKPIDRITFAGRTDLAIIKDVLVHVGVPDEEIKEQIGQIARLYIDHIRRGISRFTVKQLPGVSSLLEHLVRSSETYLTLLTGNLEESAFIKLEAAGLQSFFFDGAFGSDDEDRNLLPSVLLNRVSNTLGYELGAKHLVVIGDTPLDVASAKHSGAHSVAVSSGFASVDSLVASNPDLFLTDLTQTSLIKQYFSTLGIELPL